MKFINRFHVEYSRETNIRRFASPINPRKIVVTAFNSDSILPNYYFSRNRPFTVGVFRHRSSQRIFCLAIYDRRSEQPADAIPFSSARSLDHR